MTGCSWACVKVFTVSDFLTYVHHATSQIHTKDSLIPPFPLISSQSYYCSLWMFSQLGCGNEKCTHMTILSLFASILITSPTLELSTATHIPGGTLSQACEEKSRSLVRFSSSLGNSLTGMTTESAIEILLTSGMQSDPE